MALSLRHVVDQLFSEVRLAKEEHGHRECFIFHLLCVCVCVCVCVEVKMSLKKVPDHLSHGLSNTSVLPFFN